MNNSYNYYLVTIKTYGKSYTKADELYSFYNKCKRTFPLSEWSDLRVLEYPASGRLHLHTILIIDKKVRYSKIMKSLNTKRIYIHLKSFPHQDYNNIRNYLLKQVPNHSIQNDMLIENIMHHENLFIQGNNKIHNELHYNRHPIKTH